MGKTLFYGKMLVRISRDGYESLRKWRMNKTQHPLAFLVPVIFRASISVGIVESGVCRWSCQKSDWYILSLNFFYYYFLTKGLKIGKAREVLAGKEGGGDEEAADEKQKMLKRPEGLGKN